MTQAAAAPLCPYCGTPWTDAMLAALNNHSADTFCACCASAPRPGHLPGALALPTRDLSCDSCGRPIYRAPASSRTEGIAHE